ncbi:hypothetical protein RJT34_13892 [Clitoria ternatea]|uniref:Uncharacterized protein n=1 Tax=Clitoria ternatea TaxID=43366 RepID=A0AAN9JPS8_CLITE
MNKTIFFTFSRLSTYIESTSNNNTNVFDFLLRKLGAFISLHPWPSLSSSPLAFQFSFFFSFSTLLPLTGSPDMAVSMSSLRMVQLGNYLSQEPLTIPATTVVSLWWSHSVHTILSAVGALVRSLMTCVFLNLRLGGCPNRFILVP